MSDPKADVEKNGDASSTPTKHEPSNIVIRILKHEFGFNPLPPPNYHSVWGYFKKLTGEVRMRKRKTEERKKTSHIDLINLR
jgi:hypothetical protein